MLECGERGRRLKGVSASAQAAQECYPARVASHRRAGGDSGGIGREYLQKSMGHCYPILGRLSPAAYAWASEITRSCRGRWRSRKSARRPPRARAAGPSGRVHDELPRGAVHAAQPLPTAAAERSAPAEGAPQGALKKRSGAGSSGLSHPYRGEIPPLSGGGAVAAEEAKSVQTRPRLGSA